MELKCATSFDERFDPKNVLGNLTLFLLIQTFFRHKKPQILLDNNRIIPSGTTFKFGGPPLTCRNKVHNHRCKENNNRRLQAGKCLNLHKNRGKQRSCLEIRNTE